MLKQNEQKGGINPIIAAITVALVGVGIAVAIVLKDKKNRDKVNKVLSHVRNQAVEHMESMQKQARDKIRKTKRTSHKNSKSKRGTNNSHAVSL